MRVEQTMTGWRRIQAVRSIAVVSLLCILSRRIRSRCSWCAVTVYIALPASIFLIYVQRAYEHNTHDARVLRRFRIDVHTHGCGRWLPWLADYRNSPKGMA